MATIHKIGRRKKAIARAYVEEGKGDFNINGRDLDTYFSTEVLKYKVQQPFLLTETLGQYDISVKVHGGGNTGQAEAIRLANSRAL